MTINVRVQVTVEEYGQDTEKGLTERRRSTNIDDRQNLHE